MTEDEQRTEDGKWKIGQCSVGPETAIETFHGHNKSLWAGNEFWFSTDDRNHVNSLSEFVCFAIFTVLFARK